MNRDWWSRFGWLAAWALLVVLSLWVRDLLPVDETRYLAVAWEMWLRQDFLVPYLNGEIYSHKPPLLFWLIHAGWSLFGVNEWWPRLVPPVFALGSLFATRALARRLWPDGAVAVAAPWILAGSVFWALYTPATMFDMLLAGFTVSGLLGLIRTSDERGRVRAAGWIVFGVSLGLGVLAKGPVMFVHLLFPALLGPWWNRFARQHPGRWYGALLAAVMLGAAIALAWVIPAALRGGPAYEQAILWHQTADRMAHSFAHARPWWWYLPLLPVLWFPWLLWPPLWRGLGSLRHGLDDGERFCLAWLLPVLIVFTAISAKQPHYLLPVFPAIALLSARTLRRVREPVRAGSQWLPALLLSAIGLVLVAAARIEAGPFWVQRLEWPWGMAMMGLGALLFRVRAGRALGAVMPIAGITVAAVAVFDAAVFRATHSIFDLRPIAQSIARLQRDGVPLAHVSKYQGQFQFLGRLREPLTEVTAAELPGWLAQHPAGQVIYYTDATELPGLPPGEFVHRYRGEWLHIRPASAGLPSALAGSIGRHGLRSGHTTSPAGSS